MSLESFSSAPSLEKVSESTRLASAFRELSPLRGSESPVFKNLEEDLLNENFQLTEGSVVADIFHTPSLICRSESFTRVIDLLIDKTPITINGSPDEANMCKIFSGEGFKIAMAEGFSGKDVNGMVKVVMTFANTHLEHTDSISKTNSLWQTKPDTAEVSLSGSGQVLPEDIRMVSFRFPINYFPTELLTEDEQEQLEERSIKFIVRHYIPGIKKTIH